MNALTVQEIFEKLSKINPNPVTELKYNSPFELLVAVILSAQATDASVNKVTPILFEKLNTPESIASLQPIELEPYIQSIGLYKSKARHIIAMAKILVEQHRSAVPATRHQLEQLPGVGRKTANVILNIVFEEPTLAVDTHVFRVANRTGLAPGKTPKEVESKLMACVPEDFLMNAHHWLLLHGRHVCKAKAPMCSTCCIAERCEFNAQDSKQRA
ncbi:MAG: endonuclease III [Leptothrix ochracea]|uniref:endonuclease III n=1 Tax=Leptothrix ochracea TaxID=735331 RepID=UPI0034E25BBC